MANKAVKLFDKAFLGHKIVAPEEHKRMIDFLDALLTSEVEKAKKQYIEMGELIGVGKVLDNLWDNSYYSMGKLGVDRIEQEIIYYFGKDWNVDMYKIIAKNGMRAQSVKPLKDYTKEQRKALSDIGGGK